MKALLIQIWTYLIIDQIPADSVYVRAGLIASLTLVVLGIVIPFGFWVRSKRHTRLWFEPIIKRLSFLARIAGIVWFLLFFLRFEDIYPFDRRLWVYLLVIPVLITGILMVRNFRRTKLTVVKSNELTNRYSQYLPKPKAK